MKPTLLIICLPFRIDNGIGFHQQSGPSMQQFKVKSIGVQLKVVSSGLNEEAVLDLFFEDDLVKEPGLAELSEYVHFIHWN